MPAIFLLVYDSLGRRPRGPPHLNASSGAVGIRTRSHYADGSAPRISLNTSWACHRRDAARSAERAGGRRAAIESGATVGTEHGAFDGGAIPDRFRPLGSRHQDDKLGSTALTASRTLLAASTIDSASSLPMSNSFSGYLETDP
jgi:hypothetical protein